MEQAVSTLSTSSSSSQSIPAEFSDIAAVCAATEITIGGRCVFGIADARDLHAGLNVGRDYATWVKDRITKYGFRIGADYEMFDSPNLGNQIGRGGDRRSLVYSLTLDMAKEIAMVENNDRGRLVRRYFIWADEQFRRLSAQPRLVVDPSDPKVMLAVFDHLQKQVAEKDAIIAVQGEKVKQLDRLSAAEGSMCLRDAAKTLNIRPKDLIAALSARRWIYKRPGNSSWIAYQDKIQAGYMEHIDHPFFDDQGRERIATRAHVTAKGLVRLAELLNAPLH